MLKRLLRLYYVLAKTLLLDLYSVRFHGVTLSRFHCVICA